MIILLTTANFPDIALPSYRVSYWSMLFFVSFLVIGLYLMLNFLLANVYNQFKVRVEQKHEKIVDKTHKLLWTVF